ncbi:hypothetical protein E2562_021462 [Oryza meyeriana var. granulata]|uniref:Uncharacterized protein n=1 Tax=Oryza meyeriana var. granulata TaxID=110450 RepID=A0A6G1C8J2_9ORYZ|nr:hypothetical protein E2562_021462 [Oryza meyeriana var. granulata]
MAERQCVGMRGPGTVVSATSAGRSLKSYSGHARFANITGKSLRELRTELGGGEGRHGSLRRASWQRVEVPATIL